MARKKLNESLAKDFLAGKMTMAEQGDTLSDKSKGESDDVDDVKQLVKQEIEVKKVKKSSLVDRFKEDKKEEGTTRITIDLKNSLHRQLSQLSLDSGRTKADIIRQLITELFENED